MAGGSLAYYNWFVYEFWRFVFVQQVVAEYAKSFIDYPPMQKGATFNLEAVKAEIMKAIAGDRRSSVRDRVRSGTRGGSPPDDGSPRPREPTR